MNIQRKSILYLRGILIMSKEEYLDRLESLLMDINELDRNEALDYYRNYFEDAGLEDVESIIKNLGTPEKLAFIIRESLNGDFDESIEIGDAGVHDFYEDKHEVKKLKSKKIIDKGDKVIFLILLIAFLIPLTSFLNGVFGIIGVFLSIIMFFFGFWIASFVLYVLGGVFIAISILYFLSSLGASLVLMGVGLIFIVLGDIVGKAASWFFKTCLPYFYSKVKELFCHVTNRGVEA